MRSTSPRALASWNEYLPFKLALLIGAAKLVETATSKTKLAKTVFHGTLLNSLQIGIACQNRGDVQKRLYRSRLCYYFVPRDSTGLRIESARHWRPSRRFY